jgi:hypothetical protein
MVQDTDPADTYATYWNDQLDLMLAPDLDLLVTAQNEQQSSEQSDEEAEEQTPEPTEGTAKQLSENAKSDSAYCAILVQWLVDVVSTSCHLGFPQ